MAVAQVVEEVDLAGEEVAIGVDLTDAMTEVDAIGESKAYKPTKPPPLAGFLVQKENCTKIT